MSNRYKAWIAFLLAVIMMIPSVIISSGADTVVPYAAVHYNNNNAINSYADRANNVLGGLCYGNYNSAVHNVNGQAINVTVNTIGSGYDQNYVYTYFDKVLVVESNKQYYFALLYQTESSNLITGGGFYCSGLTGEVVPSASGRPNYASQTVVLNGVSYYLATATLDMASTSISSGQRIYGIRFNLTKKDVPYSIYAAGVFAKEDDVMDYMETKYGENASVDPGSQGAPSGHTPLALMDLTSDDQIGFKTGTVNAKGGSCWVGGDANSTISFDTQRDAVAVSLPSSSAWAALYFDRAYNVKENDSYYVAVLYETDSNTKFSSIKAYSYRSNAFLPVVDGTARLAWQYDFGFTDDNGKHYALAYAQVTDAQKDLTFVGMQIQLQINTTYYFHSAGVFREFSDIGEFYATHQKSSQKQLENIDQLLTPVWEGNTIYEESVMVMTNQNGTIDPISLLYPMDEIVSVMDAVKSIRYVEGVDYSLADGKLVIPSGSAIPVTDYNEYYFSEAGDGHKPLIDGSGYTYFVEGTYWHFRQIVVTYHHSGTWTGDIPYGQSYRLPKTMQKLKNGENLQIVVNGLSTTTGCNVSSKINAQPYLPNWATMTTQALQREYGDAEISMVNTAVGGTLAAWGAENVQSNIIDYNPDLVFIEFGLNDPDITAFRTNMQSMVASIKQALPDCEIVLVQSPLANPDVRGHYAHQDAYISVLWQIAESYEGIAVANVSTVFDHLLSVKPFRDMTGNNVNHYNDFIERVYTQVILKVFDDAEGGVNTVSDPLAFAAFTEDDTGSRKPTGNYHVNKGSIWVGGDANAQIAYDSDFKAACLSSSTSSAWAGIQFDQPYVTNQEPYYAAVLITSGNQAFKRYSDTAGFTYSYASHSDFNVYSSQFGRLKWRYDYLDSVNGIDYYIAYFRVCDVAPGTAVSGMQMFLRNDVSAYFVAAGLYNSYESMRYSFSSVIPGKALAVADYRKDTVLISSTNHKYGIPGSICYRAENISSDSGVSIQNGTAVNPYVDAYLDASVTVREGQTYYYGILYDTNSAERITGGYYCSINCTGTLVGMGAGKQPEFVSQPLVMDGKTYYLAVAKLDMNTSSIADKTVITGVRLSMSGSATSYTLYGAGIFDSEKALYEYFGRGSNLVDVSNETACEPFAYAKFEKEDTGSYKESGSYLVPAGSMCVIGNTTTIDFDHTLPAIHIKAEQIDEAIGIQFDEPYTASADAYGVAVLYGVKGTFVPFSNVEGHSYYQSDVNSFLTMGTDIGRLKWTYKFIGKVDGYNRYMAYADVSTVSAGTVVSGIQFPLKNDLDYYFYSAGIYKNSTSAMQWISDSAAPAMNGTPSFTADTGSITVSWNAANDVQTEPSAVIYKLYASEEPFTSQTLPFTAAKTVGNCSKSIKCLEYGTPYYTAWEAIDRVGNRSVWINPERVYTSAKTGDVNTDQTVDSTDIVLLKKGLLGAETVEGPYPDVNSDTQVDVRDLVRLKKLIVQQADDTVTFASLGLTTPHVMHPAEVVFGTYQNMLKLADSPEEWRFIRKYADGILFHEAYWLNSNSPQATYGKKIGNIIADSDLKVYMEYGSPKSDIVAGANDDGTAYGLANAARAFNRIHRFIENTGIQIDVLNLELYSGAVTGILGDLGLTKNWTNHYATGVPYLLKSYDAFYGQFVQDFPGVKINHVGCPNLTGWVRESEGGTLPGYWKNHYNQSYWTSYQAYDVTIPIFDKYANDGVHIGWVHDCPWSLLDLGNGTYDSNEAVLKESMNTICGTYGLQSTLIVGDWSSEFGDTITDKNAIDKFYWENSLKSIFNAQYHGDYHGQYLLESYWDGPYTMLSEDDAYSYANLVKTAIQYLKGIDQQLDLSITNSKGNTVGANVVAETPTGSQTVTRNGKSETFTVTVTNNGETFCNPWLRAVQKTGGATVTYRYKGKDITAAITSQEGFVFSDLFEDENGDFDSYTSSTDAVLDTHFDEQNHGLEAGDSVSIQVTVSGGSNGSVAICGFYNPQDPTDTIKDVVTVRF